MTTGFDMTDAAPRPLWPALRRGLARRCPRCGEGRLFHGLLTVRHACGRCGLALDGHRADDAPPYLTILLVGHLVIPGVVATERWLAPTPPTTALIWAAVAVALVLALLPSVKGAIVGLQWAQGMHGFEPAEPRR